jgi:hypothetical protein
MVTSLMTIERCIAAEMISTEFPVNFILIVDLQVLKLCNLENNSKWLIFSNKNFVLPDLFHVLSDIYHEEGHFLDKRNSRISQIPDEM